MVSEKASESKYSSERVLVVSDLHLGHEDSEYKEFANFARWIRNLEGSEKGVQIELRDGRITTVRFPDKIILLGDILELWIPSEGELYNVFKHLFGPATEILDLDCDKVYVLGNHDDDLNKAEGDYPFKEDPALEVLARHYPESVDTDSEKVGDDTYAFLHGHQFDRIFRRAGPLSKVPSTMFKLSSITSKYFPPKGWLSVFLFFLFLFGYLLPPLSRYFAYIPLPIMMVLIVYTFVFAFPRLFTALAWPFWCAYSKTRYVDMKRIVDEEFWKTDKGALIQARTVIFGHTHVPEYSTPEIVKKTGKILVNSGSWMRNPRYDHNTFIYIDKDGPVLLKWDDQNRRIVEPEFK